MRSLCFSLGLLASVLAQPLFGQALIFTNDFNSGLPPGVQLYGTATHVTSGGVGNSGAVRLTQAVNNQGGTIILGDGVRASTVGGFAARFRVRIGGGTSTPADGMSFCFGPDLPAGTFGEEGAGSGLRVCFDTFNNGGGEAPAIDIFWGPTLIARRNVPRGLLNTGTDYAHVLVRFRSENGSSLGYLQQFVAVPNPNNPPNPDPNQVVSNPPQAALAARVDVSFDNVMIFQNVRIPSVDPLMVGRFGFGARTGGLNDFHFLDDVEIIDLSQNTLSILRHPADTTVLSGRTATFWVAVTGSATSGVRPPVYQWFRNGEIIQNATNATYTTGPLTVSDSGTAFNVLVLSAAGSEMSRTGVVQVVTVPGPVNPSKFFDFNSQLPFGAKTHGSAFVDTSGGGVDGSGSLKLTEAIGSQSASLVVNDIAGGGPITSFTTSFQLLIGNPAGGTPADGFSFSMGNNIPHAPISEDGAGNGLVVSFDTYNNGNFEAPGIDIFYNGVHRETVPMLISELVNNQYVEVIIRVSDTGTLDVVHNGRVIYHNYPLGYQPFTGARFALGARTGGAFSAHYVDNWAIEAAFVPLPLQFTKQEILNDLVRIEWTGGGLLQWSTDLDPDSWVDEELAVSPFSIPVYVGDQRFFRLVR